MCTFAYGVTQAGARKILYELGIQQMNDPFDLMLRDFCDRKRGHEGNGECGFRSCVSQFIRLRCTARWTRLLVIAVARTPS